jgi:hypothetical protein
VRFRKPRATAPHKPTDPTDRQWYKLCSLLMFKLGVKEVKLTVEDMERFKAVAPLNVIYREEGDTLTLWLLNDKEAANLLKDGTKPQQ